MLNKKSTKERSHLYLLIAVRWFQLHLMCPFVYSFKFKLFFGVVPTEMSNIPVFWPNQPGNDPELYPNLVLERHQCEAWDNVWITSLTTSEDSDFWALSAEVWEEEHKEEHKETTDTRGKPAAGISNHDKNQSHDPWAESGGEETERLSVNWSFKWRFLVTRRMKQFLFEWVVTCGGIRGSG